MRLVRYYVSNNSLLNIFIKFLYPLLALYFGITRKAKVGKVRNTAITQKT